jgi:hypothetical protein
MNAPPQRAASSSRSQSRVPESEIDSQAIVASLVNFATPKRSIDAFRNTERVADVPHLSASRACASLAEPAVCSVTPLRSRNGNAESLSQAADRSASASAFGKVNTQSHDAVGLGKKIFTPKSVEKVNNASKALEEDVFSAAVKLGFKNSDIQRMPRTADEMNVIFSFAFSKALPGNSGTLVQKLRLLNLHHLASDDLLSKRDKAVQALQAIIERAELVKHVIKPVDSTSSKDSSVAAKKRGSGASASQPKAAKSSGPDASAVDSVSKAGKLVTNGRDAHTTGMIVHDENAPPRDPYFRESISNASASSCRVARSPVKSLALSQDRDPFANMIPSAAPKIGRTPDKRSIQHGDTAEGPIAVSARVISGLAPTHTQSPPLITKTNSAPEVAPVSKLNVSHSAALAQFSSHESHQAHSLSASASSVPLITKHVEQSAPSASEVLLQALPNSSQELRPCGTNGTHQSQTLQGDAKHLDSKTSCCSSNSRLRTEVMQEKSLSHSNVPFEALASKLQGPRVMPPATPPRRSSRAPRTPEHKDGAASDAEATTPSCNSVSSRQSRSSGQKAKKLSFLTAIEPVEATLPSASDSVPVKMPICFESSKDPSVTPTKSSARMGKAALDGRVDTLLGSVTPMRPASAPALNLQDQSPAAAIAGTASDAARSARKVQALAPAPSVTPTKSSARRGKAALDDRVDTLLGSVTPMRPASAPALNLQDQSPVAAIAGTASDAARSARKVPQVVPPNIESQAANPAVHSPVASAACFANRTPIRSLARRRLSSSTLEQNQQPQIAIDLTTKSSPSRARARKYSILHPDIPLLSEQADASQDSACGYSMNCDDDAFQAHAESNDCPSTFVSSAACPEQHQASSHCSVFSAQSAQQIANVFLEVVHASSMRQSEKSEAVHLMGSSCHSLPNHRVAKENKESKKQLASILKTKASASQPLEQYHAERFAKRMQLYDALSRATSMCLQLTPRVVGLLRAAALFKLQAWISAKRWDFCKLCRSLAAFVNSFLPLQSLLSSQRSAGSSLSPVKRAVASAIACGNKINVGQ